MDVRILTSKFTGILSSGLTRLRGEQDPALTERRGYTRWKVRFPAFLEMEGRRIQVQGLDLHRGGAGVTSESPMPAGALAFFCGKPFGLVGWAMVRWCIPHGASRYRIGLEFRSPLMRAPAGRWHFSCVPLAGANEPVPIQNVIGEIVQA
jgi:hypothetical protein